MALDIQTVIGDKTERAEGVWVKHPDHDGVEFCLAYLGNDNYSDFVGEKILKATKGRRNAPPEKKRAIVNQGLLKFIIKGWKGLTTNGQPFEFTPENAKALIEQSPEIRQWIIEESNDLDNFGAEAEEDSPTGTIKSGAPVEPAVG